MGKPIIWVNPWGQERIPSKAKERCKYHRRQNSGAELEYYEEMVSKYVKNGRIIYKDETFINEKETFCD